MGEVSRITIKQLEDRVATSGVHMGGGPERRKLLPGEVVEVPHNLTVRQGAKEVPLIEILWATKKLELTRDPVTRPLDYRNAREARLHAPNYRPQNDSEAAEVDSVAEAVAERLSGMSLAPSPEVEEDGEEVNSPPMPSQRRGRRRAVAESGDAKAPA